MAIILGLDVSTSCTGYCVLNSEWNPGDNYLLDRVEFKKCKTFWDKCDLIEQELGKVEGVLHAQYHVVVERIVLEEPLMGFRPGMSSAQTISMLLRFNGIVSNLARKRFGVTPEYISANHARKAVGIKLQRTSVAGMSQKEQVFKHMSEHDLKDVQWPVKKSGLAVDWSRDATDAYVIARAAAIDGPIVPSEKPKKSKKAA
jgi:hypothetical protein